MFTNYLNSVVGRNQEFEQLIKAKDISRVKEMFSTRETLVSEAIKEYDPNQHEIMKRPDKVLTDAKGERKGTLKRWKLPMHSWLKKILNRAMEIDWWWYLRMPHLKSLLWIRY